MIRLNLLSPANKKMVAQEILLRSLFIAAIFLVIWSALFFVFVGQSWFFLSIQNRALQNRLAVEASTDSSQKLQSFEAVLKSVNATVLRAEDVLKLPSYSPNAIFDIVVPLIPDGVSLAGFDLNAPTRKLTLSGKAVTRESFLLFEKNLKGKTSVFSEVNSPLSNVLKPDNITFVLVLTLK